MPLLLICILIFLIYIQTYNYKYIIDDNIKRAGYLYENTDIDNAPKIEFYQSRPAIWYRLFMIATHCINTSIVYLLWGWGAALIFAVHPVSVWPTAWVTGNYYGTATMFILISYYAIVKFSAWWSALIFLPIFVAALNSTIQPIIFPFILLATGYFWQGALLLIPLVGFMFGERFQVGYTSRHFGCEELFHRLKFNKRRPFLMVKVMRMYVMQFFFPKTCTMFHPLGYEAYKGAASYDGMHTANKDFWGALLILVSTFALGIIVNWQMTLWAFAFLLLHSQYKILGQFFAQRYIYMMMVGLCVIVGTILQPYPYLLLCVAVGLTIRTLFFIPHFQDMAHFYVGELKAHPTCAEMYKNLAGYYILEGINKYSYRFWELIYLFTRGLSYDPESWGLHNNFAGFWDRLGMYDLALFHSKKVQEIVYRWQAPQRLREEADMLVDSYERRIKNGDLKDRKVEPMENLAKTIVEKIQNGEELETCIQSI